MVVDYLQRLRPAEGDRRLDERLRVSMACLGLRQLARDLDVPVLAISSVGRTSYQGQPTLDWYKGSGDLEYDADCCLLLKPRDDTSDRPARISAHPRRPAHHEKPLRRTHLRPPHPPTFDRRYGTFHETPTPAGGPPPPPRLAPSNNYVK